MKKLTAMIIVICLLLSLSCAAVAAGGVTATETQYLSWETVRNDKLNLVSFYQDSLNELDASDVHLILQYVADEDDGAFLTIVDGEVVYDVFA